MEWLCENPLAIAMAGILLVTGAGVVYSQTRSFRSLMVMFVFAGATLLAVLLERAIKTTREQLTTTLYQLARSVEQDDLEATLAIIDANAVKLRAEAEDWMPQLSFSKARITSTPEILISSD